MTGWLWLVVAGLGVLLFTLGGLAAHVFWHADQVGKVNTVLMCVFGVVAAAVAVDTVQLQIAFRQHVNTNMSYEQSQIDCNRQYLRVFQAIATARRDVDQAAAAYDTALTIFLDDESDTNRAALVARLRDVQNARIAMVRVYDTNPYPDC